MRSDQVYWRGPVTNTVYFPLLVFCGLRREHRERNSIHHSDQGLCEGWLLWQNAAVSWRWWWWCYCVKLHFVWPRAPARADKSATNVNHTHTETQSYMRRLQCTTLLPPLWHVSFFKLIPPVEIFFFFFYHVDHSGLCSIRLCNPFRLTATQIWQDHLTQGQILMVMYTGCVATPAKIRGSWFFFQSFFFRGGVKAGPGAFFFFSDHIKQNINKWYNYDANKASHLEARKTIHNEYFC